MPNMQFPVSSKVGAGDLPAIPIGPVESFHEDDDENYLVTHHDKGRPIETHFLFHDVIGTGGFSKVKKATHKATGETYAIKVLDKSKMEGENFPRVILEIETLASVRHPAVAKLYSAFYTSTKIYMVMELCWTDLFEYLVKLNKPMPESRAREFFIQLLSAISYLHSMGIVHRDIKPENILLTEKMKLRLTDFGFAGKLPERRNYFLSTFCGSLAYSAPEIITGVPYCGIKADTWSIGVNLYVLLVNKQPFHSKDVHDLRAQIISGRFPIPSHLKKKSINLIKRLLQNNPLDRVPLEEVWMDPWLQDASIPENFYRLYYSYHRHDFDVCKIPYQRNGKGSSLFWGHQPSCRTEPVQIEKTKKSTVFRQLFHSIGRGLSKCVDFVACRKIGK